MWLDTTCSTHSTALIDMGVELSTEVNINRPLTYQKNDF